VNRYYIMSGADISKPGTGDIERPFDAQSDEDAMELARRHYENTDFTVWAKNGTNRLGHFEYRFVGSIK
jgi:hypothetical protein